MRVAVTPTRSRRSRATTAGIVLALAVGMLLTPAAAAQQPSCGTSPAGNGTGYTPTGNASSLPVASPRPGPDILYEPLPTAPQLENTGRWRAPPIMVSGTRSYRNGEFLYQDFLYDDRALTYPDEPHRYAGNAADIVEVRLRPLDDALAIRITYNSMLEPDAVAATIALGESTGPRPLPHDAGATAPGEVFVTIHGCEGDIVDADSGTALDIGPVVTTDLERRQVDVRVPYEAFDPRGRTGLRVAAAAGLWDPAAGRYLRPDPARPAFFNVAFRDYDAWTHNTWMDSEQNTALATGDISPFFASVDLTRLAAAVDDDMADQPGGVPSQGPMNRILVSRFEPTQGRGNSAGGIVGDHLCEPPDCTYQYSGRLQPYTVYVPDAPPPAGGYGLVVNLHGAMSNHNHLEPGGPPPPEQWRILAENGGRPSIMVLPNARGESYFYHGLAGADVFEVWADVAARYDLHPGHTVLTGSSMGGFGTYKLGVQFPDLFSAIFPNVGINTAALSVPPVISLAGDEGDAWRMFASLRNVPVLATNGLNDPVVSYQNTSFSMRTLDDLGYRYDYWWFAGVGGGAGHAEYRHHVPDEFARLMTDHGPTDLDPHRVTYVLNAAMSEPRYGLTADHAYWLSNLALRDKGALYGTIDVVSRGLPGGDPQREAQESLPGGSANGSLPYERLRRAWGPVAASATVADVLDITASNVAKVTIDVDRARVSCDATVNVDSDGPLEVTLTGAQCGASAPDHPTPIGGGGTMPATGGGLAVAGLLVSLLAAAGARRHRGRGTSSS